MMNQELGFTSLPALTARLKAQQAAQDFQRRVFPVAGPVDLHHFASEAVRVRFGGFAPSDIDVLVAIVLSETLRSLEEDLKEIVEALNELKRARSKLQGAVRSAEVQAARATPARTSRGPAVRRQIAPSGPADLPKMKQTSRLGIPYHALPDADGGVLGAYNDTFLPSATVQGLKSLLDDMKGKLDGMNELSEMTSLRLQMTMDRRSKFISTLSNIMKKISTTQDTLVQNIK